MACALIGAAASCTAFSAAQAQQGRSEAVANEPEIIVTSGKREQNLRDFPSSVAVITSEDIAETGKDSFADFINTVPGLSVASNGPGYSTLAIRGITTGRVRQDEPQNKETVGLYLGDVPISANGFDPDLGLFDIERVEVLRGPQGTLYGSGSLGGTIRIVPNAPGPAGFAAGVEGTASTTRHGGFDNALRGMVNVPAAKDVLALRVTAYRNRLSGYIDDTETGATNVNDSRTQGGRIQVGAAIGAVADVRLMALVHDLKTGALSEQFAPHQRGVRTFDGNSDNLKVYSGSVNFDLGGATITSSTSYVDKANVNRLSLEFLLSSQLGLDAKSPLVDSTRIDDFTQELRVASAGRGRLEYVAGIFYQHHKRNYWQSADVPGLDAHLGIASQDLGTPKLDQFFYGTQFIDQDQLAGFGEVTVEVVQGLKATMGLRVFEFREHYESYSSGIVNGGTDASSGKIHESGLNPKFELAFQPDRNRLFYLEATRGYRLGGVNTTVPLDLCSADLAGLKPDTPLDRFKSDSVWNFETGTRYKRSDEKFAFDASAYYIKWNNIQTTLSLPTCFFAFRSNAGSARSAGMEVEISIRPASGSEISGSLGLVDSRLTEDVPFTDWQDGDRVPYVSPVQVNLGVRQEFFLIPDANSFVRLDYTYLSKARTSFDAESPTSRNFNGYGLVNFALGTQLASRPRLELVLFARNLADSHGRIAASPGNAIAPERFVTVRPRTIGVTFRVG